MSHGEKKSCASLRAVRPPQAIMPKCWKSSRKPPGPHLRHSFKIRNRRQRDSDISELLSVDAFVVVAGPRERRSHAEKTLRAGAQSGALTLSSSRGDRAIGGAQHKSPCTASDGNREMMRVHRVGVAPRRWRATRDRRAARRAWRRLDRLGGIWCDRAARGAARSSTQIHGATRSGRMSRSARRAAGFQGHVRAPRVATKWQRPPIGSRCLYRQSLIF